MSPRRARGASLAALSALALSACGDLGTVALSRGSGATSLSGSALGSGVQRPPLDAQLALTNTYAAHKQGYTGQGVTIGVVDSGIMPNNPALAGRVLQELIYVDPTENDTSIPDVVGHGTWVAQIAAGHAFGQFAGGIAPAATLISSRILGDDSPGDSGLIGTTPATPADAVPIGQVNSGLIDSGAKVMLNAWDGITWSSADTATSQAFDSAYSPYVKTWGGLVVFAAGDDSQSNPDTIAALPSQADDPALQHGGWLTVVAVNSNSPGHLDSYSNRCGVTMNYCLAAPGDVIVLDQDTLASTTNPSYYIVEGTGFAAPQVAGAAALVWQAYPYFSNDLVGQTLLGTATALGGSQPNPTFGYGELDVGKAVNGPAQFNWGDVTVRFSGASSWNNPISGAGGLIKQGSGTLTLTRPAGYTGLTQVQGGTLSAVSLASPVDVGSGATLSVASSVGGTIDNGGTLVVGGGTLKVSGNYVQQSGGRLAVPLGSALSVSGTATLSGGSLYVYGADQGYTLSSHTEVLTAGGGLIGTFSGLSMAGSVTLSATIEYDANSAWLDVSQVNLTQIRGLPYSAASYQAAVRAQDAFEQIDAQLSGGPVRQRISGGFIGAAATLQHSASVTTLQQSLQSLSGQLHGASAAMTLQAMDAGTDALSTRFDQLLDAAPDSAHPRLWSRTLNDWGNLSQYGYGSVGYDESGALAGEDTRIGRHGVMGLAISQTEFLGQLAGSFDHSRSVASEGLIYAGVMGHNAYAMAAVGVGRYREAMRRLVQLDTAGLEVSSDADGADSVAYGESGYRLELGRLRLTPYAELQYGSVWGAGFEELGGDGFGLMAPGHTVQRWQAGVGLHADRRWRFSGGSLSLRTRVLWQRALALRGVAFDASFTGLQQWTPLNGVSPSRYGSLLGETLDWRFSARSSLLVDYARQAGQHEVVRTMSLTYRWSF
jgi:autotransporter-associated beta strand protein